jgi:hypothetical protein
MMCTHGVDCHAFVRTLASLGGALARRTSPSAAPQPPLSRPSAAHLALGLCATRRRRHGVVCLVLRAICPFPFGWALGPPVGRRPTRAKRASCVERNRIFTASPSASQRSASAQLLYSSTVSLYLYQHPHSLNKRPRTPTMPPRRPAAKAPWQAEKEVGGVMLLAALFWIGVVQVRCTEELPLRHHRICSRRRLNVCASGRANAIWSSCPSAKS